MIKLKDLLNENSDKAKLYKLYTKAMKMMPGSPAQKKIKKEIDKLRNKLGLNEKVYNLEEKTISIDTAQDMRKAGYWIVVSNNLKKVIAVDKDEDKMMDLYKQNSRKTKIFGPLKTIKISPAQQREYDRIHKLIWKSSKFGG